MVFKYQFSNPIHIYIFCCITCLFVLLDMRLRMCPSLHSPPIEVSSRGTASVMAYLKRLKGGFAEYKRTKLMLVGLGGVGKTRYFCSSACADSWGINLKW